MAIPFQMQSWRSEQQCDWPETLRFLAHLSHHLAEGERKEEKEVKPVLVIYRRLRLEDRKSRRLKGFIFEQMGF